MSKDPLHTLLHLRAAGRGKCAVEAQLSLACSLAADRNPGRKLLLVIITCTCNHLSEDAWHLQAIRLSAWVQQALLHSLPLPALSMTLSKLSLGHACFPGS